MDVSAKASTSVSLGNGKEGIVNISISPGGHSGTNHYYYATVRTDTIKTIRKPLIKTNEVIGFSAGGEHYTATLRLTRSPFKDLGKVEFLEDSPTSVDLGDGRRCNVTASTRRDGGIGLSVRPGSSDFQTWVEKPGDSICFTNEGEVFAFTPVLKPK